MSSFGQGSSASHHPSYVAIPDPKKVQGVRSYREPIEPRPLQLQFLTPEGERDFIEQMRALLIAGKHEEADGILARHFDGFDGSIARLCKALRPEDIALDGWEDLLPILEEYEGPAIAAITVGLTNEPDLVFEGGQMHAPLVVIGLYSEDAYNFCGSDDAALLAECASECPAWIGHEEDVEFYAEMPALAELNTALIQNKHRYYLRDGRDGPTDRAPGGYVEYVLGCWFRAVRFLQALERAVAGDGLPKGARLMAGTAALHTDFATLVVTGKQVDLDKASVAARPVATLTMKAWAPKVHPDLAVLESGSALRHKAQQAAETDVVATPVAEPEVRAAQPLQSPPPAATPAAPPLSGEIHPITQAGPNLVNPQTVSVAPPANSSTPSASRTPVGPATSAPRQSWISRLFSRRARK